MGQGAAETSQPQHCNLPCGQQGGSSSSHYCAESRPDLSSTLSATLLPSQRQLPRLEPRARLRSQRETQRRISLLHRLFPRLKTRTHARSRQQKQRHTPKRPTSCSSRLRPRPAQMFPSCSLKSPRPSQSSRQHPSLRLVRPAVGLRSRPRSTWARDRRRPEAVARL